MKPLLTLEGLSASAGGKSVPASGQPLPGDDKAHGDEAFRGLGPA
ncbi:MAG: hypothetical protein ACRDV9_02065 [Acidimicrobiia bacterium]